MENLLKSRKFYFILFMGLAGIGVVFVVLQSLFAQFDEAPLLGLREKNESRSSFDPATSVWKEVKRVPWQARDSHMVFLFQDKMWLTGGLDGNEVTINNTPNYEHAKYYNDMWVSTDGEHWERKTEHVEFPPIRSSSIFSFGNTLYMLGGWSPETGYTNGIWKSQDGIHWERIVRYVPWEEREGQKVVEWNGKLLLIGGVNYFGRKTFNDVWISDDAVHWSILATSTPWHSRWDHDVAFFQGKLWLVGGMNFGDVGYHDIWSSENGKDWEQVTQNPPWGRRQGHGMVVYQDVLWLVGGMDPEADADIQGDTWFTRDGAHWQKINKPGKWLGREDHGVIVFHNKIWLTGGMNSEWEWNNEVWSLSLP